MPASPPLRYTPYNMRWKMRILLADDRPRVRAALRLLLEQEPDMVVVGEAADAASLRLALQRETPDLLLLDWELPGLPRLQPVYFIRNGQPRLRILALSGRPEARAEALSSGADGFASKGDPPENILAAVRACEQMKRQSNATGDEA